MTRLLVGLAVATVVLTVYALVDAALFDRNRIRGLPRFAWILVVLFVPIIGPLLWIVVGRGRRGSVGRQPRTMAPDDDLEFLGQLGRDAEQEQRIRKLEEELADLDGGPASASDKPVDDRATPDAKPNPTGDADGTGDTPGAPGSRDA